MKFYVIAGFSLEKNICTLFAVCFLTSLLPKGIAKYLSIFIHLAYIGFSFHAQTFSAVPNKEVFFTIFDSHLRESADFLATYLKPHILILFLPLASFYVIPRRISPIWPKRIILVVGIFSLFTGLRYRALINSPFGVFFHYSDYKDAVALMTSSLKHRKINFALSDTPFKTLVIIIGESLNKNHMSLYGYSRDTSPLLSKREDLIVFKNVTSPHTHTNTSLHKIFTQATHSSPKAAEDRGDIFDILKSANISSYWISNQTALEGYDLTSSLYALKSTHRSFSTTKLGHDEIILPRVEEVLQKDEKKVVFIHLMGSHFVYKERYPDRYSTFKNGKNLIVDQYDNSVLYNDYIVNRIFDLDNRSDTLMIYLSDHGEEVYDLADFAGHNEARATKSMYQVPFILKTSASHRFSKYADKVYSTENFIQTIQSIMGVLSEFYDPTLDLLVE